MELRVYTCPKKLLNGPCGGVVEGRCEATGEPCPWKGVIERLSPLEQEMLFDEHPLLAQLERLVDSDPGPADSSLWEKVTRGKVLTVEFPVRAVRSEGDIRRLAAAVEADLFTVPDNPLGYPHFDPVAFGTRLKDVAPCLGVMPHITAKDRNLSALASELRTAHVFGFEAVLLTTGDWPGLSMPSRPVFDLDSANLIRLARIVFAGVLPPGERVPVGGRPIVAGAMNPHYRPRVEARRLLRKLIAGVEVFFTQVVARKESVWAVSEVLEKVRRVYESDVPVVVSLVYPLRQDMKPFLERMGIPTGDDTFEGLLEEVKALDVKGGINLIVVSRTADEWVELWGEARELVKEVLE